MARPQAVSMLRAKRSRACCPGSVSAASPLGGCAADPRRTPPEPWPAWFLSGRCHACCGRNAPRGLSHVVRASDGAGTADDVAGPPPSAGFRRIRAASTAVRFDRGSPDRLRHREFFIGLRSGFRSHFTALGCSMGCVNSPRIAAGAMCRIPPGVRTPVSASLQPP